MLRIPIQILFLGFILLLVDQLEAQQAIQQWPYTITFTEVKGDTTEVDVKDAASEVPIYHLAISDLFKGHYHLAEFHNGNLYTIRRTGGPDGYIKFPGSWTDALWKFDGSGNGKKIYSVRGLDFRVSPDERTIAINIIWDTLFNSGFEWSHQKYSNKFHLRNKWLWISLFNQYTFVLFERRHREQLR